MMELAKQQFSVLITSWMYYLRVPLPKIIIKYADYSQSSLESAAKYLPLAGIFVGATAGAVFLASDWLFGSKAMAVALSMVASVVMTGALHEDGLADFFDAFWGGWWSKERILEIMKDSRLGTFGTLALILVMLLKFQSLVAIPPAKILLVLVAVHAFSRLAAISFLFSQDYVRENDKSYFKPMMKKRMSKKGLLLAAVFGVAPSVFLLGWSSLILLPLMWGVRSLFGRWYIQKLGGYTGDCLGATQQVVEVCFYIALVAAYRLWL